MADTRTVCGACRIGEQWVAEQIVSNGSFSYFFFTFFNKELINIKTITTHSSSILVKAVI